MEEVTSSLLRRSAKVKRQDLKKISPKNAVKNWMIYNTYIIDYIKENPKNSILFKLEDFIANDLESIALINQKLNLDLDMISNQKLFSPSLLTNKNNSNQKRANNLQNQLSSYSVKF
jgi:hypothetical protein